MRDYVKMQHCSLPACPELPTESPPKGIPFSCLLPAVFNRLREPGSTHLWEPDWDSLASMNAFSRLLPTASIVTAALLSSLSPEIRHTREEGV